MGILWDSWASYRWLAVWTPHTPTQSLLSHCEYLTDLGHYLVGINSSSYVCTLSHLDIQRVESIKFFFVGDRSTLSSSVVRWLDRTFVLSRGTGSHVLQKKSDDTALAAVRDLFRPRDFYFCLDGDISNTLQRQTRLPTSSQYLHTMVAPLSSSIDLHYD